MELNLSGFNGWMANIIRFRRLKVENRTSRIIQRCKPLKKTDTRLAVQSLERGCLTVSRTLIPAHQFKQGAVRVALTLGSERRRPDRSVSRPPVPRRTGTARYHMPDG